MTEIVDILAAIGCALTALNQIIAFFGKPNWLRKHRKIADMVDFLAGNHRHSANLIE